MGAHPWGLIVPCFMRHPLGAHADCFCGSSHHEPVLRRGISTCSFLEEEEPNEAMDELMDAIKDGASKGAGKYR